MSEDTKRKISLAKKGVPRPEEVRRKISQSHLGKPRSDDTRQKISTSNHQKPKTLTHRYNISVGRTGIQHSDETKRKIGLAVSATKQRLRRQKLAARAAAAAEAATADLRPAFFVGDVESSGENSVRVADASSDDEGSYDTNGLLNMLELEKAVIEVTSLRNALSAWMDAYEARNGRKPNLTEASETHPQVYGKFVRYVALRELVRRSSLAIGHTPVSWE
jgi:hypothetical protein